jgi:hypothetical protein
VPRERDYQAENKARRKQFRDLPAKVAYGHGEIPAYIARKAEAGTLTAREQRIYKRRLIAYQARYGPTKSKKRPGVRHNFPELFDSRGDAIEAIHRLRIPYDPGDPENNYARIQKKGDKWQVIIFR